MCCLFLILAFLGPRFASVAWWLLYPARWNLAFSSVIWPILGILFLPWTTLAYIIVFQGGIIGIEWLFIVIAVFFDLSSYGGAIAKSD